MIRESLRLSQAVTGGAPRVCKEEISYKRWRIPGGTPVSLSSHDVHTDEEIFAESKAFMPERVCYVMLPFPLKNKSYQIKYVRN